TGLISQCSSASQILLHLQHTISTTRRTLVASNLKSEIKTLAEDSKLDTMLFGADFQSKVKVQEEMAKVGKSFLQPKTPYSKTVGKSFPSKNKFVKNVRKESLNSKSPLRSSHPYRRQSGRPHYQRHKFNIKSRR
ncbi:unnamed protein product, partial [Allacma fusca]